MPTIVVFDLDETLGDFSIVSQLWPHDVVEKENFATFCHFMNKNAQCYSPLINHLPQLVAARERGDISAIVIYTNNNGHSSWANAIAGHIGVMIGQRVFDAVICGYKPTLGSNQCRSSHKKTYSDLCRCLNVGENTKIIFIDDQEHNGMRHPNVNYIRTTPFYKRIRTPRTKTRRVKLRKKHTRRVDTTQLLNPYS